ncbi:hypothetical protein B6U90_06735 [Thermoplasmatales archaeon ex4484_6]|nr:MAG: hypothetical protein B6U90_06735 [Thermoplasmatales archaeon ex4484_6]
MELRRRVLKEPLSKGGISIDLISTERLEEMGREKIRFILDSVKDGKVLVLEKGLTSSEELELIKVTMSEIDHDSFIGVETPGFTGNVTRRTLLQRLLRRPPPPRMMVVGPAHLLKTIKKDGRTIEAIILTRASDEEEEISDEIPISEDEIEIMESMEGAGPDIEIPSDEE